MSYSNNSPSSGSSGELNTPYVDPALVDVLASAFDAKVTRLNNVDYSLRHVSEMIGEQRVIQWLRSKVLQQEEDSKEDVSP